jgi:hypothetical protein
VGRGFGHPHGRYGQRYGRGLRMHAGARPGYRTRAGSIVRRPGAVGRTVPGRSVRYGRAAGSASSCGHCCCCR